jgi:hypothetical protein
LCASDINNSSTSWKWNQLKKSTEHTQVNVVDSFINVICRNDKVNTAKCTLPQDYNLTTGLFSIFTPNTLDKAKKNNPPMLKLLESKFETIQNILTSPTYSDAYNILQLTWHRRG